MRAAILRAHGATPELGDFPEPTPGPGQSTVDVIAGGLNPLDLHIASGKFYGAVPALPSVVGREGVGVLPDGRRVLFGACVAPYGSFAERAVIDDPAAVELPGEVDDGTAIALWTSGLAAWMPFTRMARLQEGESVLVLGASGVVGQLALQTARILGAGHVAAAARSREGLAQASALGADETIDLSGQGLAARLRLVAPNGFDIVLDLLWGAPARAALDTLGPWGRMVQVGSPAGTEIPVPATALRSRNLSLMGYQSGLVPSAERETAYRELLRYAINGTLSVDVERIPLQAIADAWSRQASGPRRKLIIDPND